MRPIRVPVLLMTPVLFALLMPSFSHAAEPGDLWDTTIEIKGGGMSLPARKQQICTPRGVEGPEAMSAEDNRCQMTDIQRSPGRFSYKVSCPDGSGTGEMIYQGKDSYTSTMTMTTQGQTMTMKTQGKRVGDCDASAQKKQFAAAQAQAASAMAQTCAAAVESLNPQMLDPAMGLNCDAKYKQQLCNKFGTPAGFDVVADRSASAASMPAGLSIGTLNEVGAFCGTDVADLQAKLCKTAESKEDLTFIGKHCPVIAAPIAQRECAGRNFTSPPAEKYREFCYAYARDVMQGEGDAAAAAEGAAAPSAKDLVKQGTQRLKGLFGR